MLKELYRHLPSATGVAALVAWAVAFQQSLPRMLAGPICSSAQDSWVFAGHCPACYVAALLSVAYLGSLLLAGQQTRRHARATLPVDAGL